MSHPEYSHIGQPDDRVIEECSELIQAICKARRFGLDSCFPGKSSPNNMQQILLEMEDTMSAIIKYKDYLKSL